MKAIKGMMTVEYATLEELNLELTEFIKQGWQPLGKPDYIINENDNAGNPIGGRYLQSFVQLENMYDQHFVTSLQNTIGQQRAELKNLKSEIFSLKNRYEGTDVEEQP